MVVGRRVPFADDIVSVFVKAEVKTEGVVGGATDAVVTF